MILNPRCRRDVRRRNASLSTRPSLSPPNLLASILLVVSAFAFADFFQLTLAAAAASASPEGGQDGPFDGTEPGSKAGGPTVRLSNGRTDLPLIGVGVGNLAHELIPLVLGEAVRYLEHRMVDTAAASKNERIVADAVASAVDGGAVHVVTKVWYTHLGYERTRLAVLDSLSQLGGDGGGDDGGAAKPEIKVHVLLHWPRCYENVPWMDCEGEEDRLPQEIKNAGPPPHLDRDEAWKGSWRALEDLYAPVNGDAAEEDDSGAGQPVSHDNAVLESIGVSNFEMDDMRALLAECRITPHIYQGNIWTLLHDPHLATLLRENNVHFQAYNVMNGILGQSRRAPNARFLLDKLGRDLYSWAVRGPDGRIVENFPPYPASTVLLAWLVQSGVSVIPRASSVAHRRMNSPSAVLSMPLLPQEMRLDIERAASALLRGEDLDHPSPMGPDAVSVTFRNGFASAAMRIFWIHSETGEEFPQHEQPIGPGEEMRLGSHPGHRFVAYMDEEGKGGGGGGGGGGGRRKEFLVKVDYGEHERFHVEEL